ncbi:VacJ family lipoprotein [Seongchinamella sediminis]|uniref:VacJ family lipoprotein n=1 Tax=Seongchinamella sediminis TaxID=2283635 RepID=A0A3L7E2F5_9GAMM|nr:VacJ family lipoprotein [Seongchinamella sediminis]RLQ23209.1 VacJ family lipoprotein [Seongchinamella sediminis]
MTVFRSLLLLLALALPLAVNGAGEEARNVDPFESFNRTMFSVNNTLDKYLVRPIAVGYDWVLPGFAKRGVGNVFANFYDFNSAINSVLQGRFAGAGQSGGRFLLNSTIGLAGLFDVATPMGVRPYRTDFGHTLSVWGLDSGPYLMVPLFGPRTVRSGTGTIFDAYTSVPTYMPSVALRNSLWGLGLVDGRARLLDADELISGDRYIFVRDAYLSNREAFVNDGVIQDDFSDFEEGEDFEDF